MYSVSFNTKQFDKDMRKLVEYSEGFLSGVMLGRTAFLNNFGFVILEGMKQFIDSMAKVDPQLLQHMYEWEQSGSPNARLYDLNYVVSAVGLSINATFRQSTSIKNGSKEPFYDKARIMEQGVPVKIEPRLATVLTFNEDGEQVFTKKEVRISNPGGLEAKGGFQQTLDTFFNSYMRQSFLESSGILDRLRNMSDYTKNLKLGVRLGKTHGRQVGYKWIVSAGVIK